MVRGSFWSGEPNEYEYEDPAESWIDLVTACHEPDHVARKQRIEQCLVKARSSHWTMELFVDCRDAETVDWGKEVSFLDDSGTDASISEGSDDEHLGRSAKVVEMDM
jgi:hypothetical protein